jgi:hypothetical protein
VNQATSPVVTSATTMAAAPQPMIRFSLMDFASQAWPGVVIWVSHMSVRRDGRRCFEKKPSVDLLGPPVP